jgi:CubicO group peptidase (beta-lactamase class C family)
MAFSLVENGRLKGLAGDRVRIPWWSFTKTVIAAAALALCRDGRLSLDRMLPAGYTLRHLLQHRAGLVDYGGLGAYHEAVARGDAPWSEQELLERTDAERLRYPPGQGWDYSNIGYRFAGRLVEDASGDELGAALDRLVLTPLGIASTRLARVPTDLDGVNLGTIRSYHPGWVYHGLLVGPLGEAALLLDRLLTGDFLPNELLSAMRDPHPLPGRMAGRPWAEPGYGLGLMAGQGRFGWRVEGHTGGGPGSTCAVYHRPGSQPRRTAAAFAAGDRGGFVERRAFRAGS